MRLNTFITFLGLAICAIFVFPIDSQATSPNMPLVQAITLQAATDEQADLNLVEKGLKSIIGSIDSIKVSIKTINGEMCQVVESVEELGKKIQVLQNSMDSVRTDLTNLYNKVEMVETGTVDKGDVIEIRNNQRWIMAIGGAIALAILGMFFSVIQKFK